MKCLKCHHDALDGSEYCPAHGSEPQRVRRYKLTSKKLQDRITELEAVDNPASLEAEVYLAHSILEERINSLGEDPTASELASAHSAINDSVRTIEKLVASMHKQNLASGEVLTKDSAYRLIGAIVDAVSSRLLPFEELPEYPGVVDGIASDCQKLVEEANNE